MEHFYRNVPRLGNVAVSRHAQARIQQENISSELFERVLMQPAKADVPDGQDVLWREREGVRLVILTNPIPNHGAKLIKTVYRIKGQALARR